VSPVLLCERKPLSVCSDDNVVRINAVNEGSSVVRQYGIPRGSECMWLPLGSGPTRTVAPWQPTVSSSGGRPTVASTAASYNGVYGVQL
jgi:hypothetical protein